MTREIGVVTVSPVKKGEKILLKTINSWLNVTKGFHDQTLLNVTLLISVYSTGEERPISEILSYDLIFTVDDGRRAIIKICLVASRNLSACSCKYYVCGH